MAKEQIYLSPKARFVANHAAASAHSDAMASPQFQAAAAAAMLHYQYRVNGSDPTVLAIAASKLKGAQEFLDQLMNLGIPGETVDATTDYALTPPEQSLNRPYNPPPRK